MPWHLILPLCSGFVYVAAALFLKRAAALGANVWRVTRACNLITALVFAPLVLHGGVIPPLSQFWQPAIVALLFVGGQILTVFCLRIGDVSVATPVLGLKILLVAGMTTALTGEKLSAGLWVAAALSAAAIALLQASRPRERHHVGATIALAALAAASYALFDVLVQKWSPAWGVGRFLPIMMAFVVVFSLAFPSPKTASSSEERKRSNPALAAGAICLALQAIMLVSTIAIHGQAAVANVLYSSRGLWSVLAVWLIGHWFNNQEQALGARVLAWRLCGALLMLSAIGIVLSA